MINAVCILVMRLDDERKGHVPSFSVLCSQRKDGTWGLPGGKVEANETVVEAAARELLEETGIECEIGNLVPVFTYLDRTSAIAICSGYLVTTFVAAKWRDTGRGPRNGEGEIEWSKDETLQENFCNAQADVARHGGGSWSWDKTVFGGEFGSYNRKLFESLGLNH